MVDEHYGLDGRTAIITGGATGIGKAIAQRFLHGGASVVIADIDEPGAERAADELRTLGHCVAVPTDVTNEVSVRSLVAAARSETKSVDYLVNCAGVHLHKLVVETDRTEWDRQLAVQLTGPFLCSREVASDMVQHQTRGAIINIVSAAARMGRVKGAAHCVSKAGLVMLTQVMAMELGAAGIRVNAVGPGLIDTESQRSEDVISTAYKESYIRELPLGRLGEPVDVAEAVLFLSSDSAKWITGQTLYVDGGFLAGNLSLQGLHDLFSETPLRRDS